MRLHRATAVALLLLAVGIFGVAPLTWQPLAQSIRAGKLAVVEIGALCAAAAFLRWWPMRCLAWWTILSFCLHYNAVAMSTTWRLLLGLLAIEQLARAKIDLALLLTGWRILTMLHTGYMLLQLTGMDPIFSYLSATGGSPATGFMDNEWAAAGYTAMTLPLFFDGKFTIRGLGVNATISRCWWLLPSLGLILVSGALGAVLVTMVVLGLWMIRSTGRWRGVVLLSCVALALLYNRVEPIRQKLVIEQRNRVLVWKEAVRLSYHSTWTALAGYGPGQFRRVFRRDAHIADYLKWSVAHNEPLQLKFELGDVGLWLLLIAALTWMGIGLWSASLRPLGEILTGWCSSSLIIFAGHLACLVVVAILCAGVLEGARRQRSLA